ncbi:DNA-binding IclR family transcriptional regulator [Mycetocola sp. CAN_C7]|uniref:IclR family transcriptional regulator n=1 Tax=Mycetocola sp. CAN_C7 TaxID=2787724 RepID=UPI0018CBE7D9
MVDQLQSVTHALQLLRLLERTAPSGVSDLSKELGVSSSTVHRLLTTMVSEGFVRQVAPTKKYGLARGISLTSPSDILARCIRSAEDDLKLLRDSSGETVHLAVLNGLNTRYVAAVESDRMMKVTGRVGEEAPAHATAAGKILLSYRSDDELRRLYNRRVLETPTEFTIGDVDVLLREIADAGARGYGRNISESEIGVYTMAVVVEDSRGKPVCSMSVAGPSARIIAGSGSTLSPDEEHILSLLTHHKKRIEQALAGS